MQSVERSLAELAGAVRGLASAEYSASRILAQVRQFIDSGAVLASWGEISVDDNAEGQALASSAEWYAVTQFDTDGEARGTTPDAANDKVTVANAGVYEVKFTGSFNGSANVTYHLAIYIGGVPDTSLKVERTIGTGNDVGAVAISGFATIAAGEAVELCVNANGDSKSFVLGHGNLNVRSCGGF